MRRPSSPPAPEPSRSTYGRPFWLAYLSNALLLAAVALLFRYADFVTLLGGTEFHLGWIVGIGMVGSFFDADGLGLVDRPLRHAAAVARLAAAVRRHLLRPSGRWPATPAWPSTCCGSRIAARWRASTAPR